LRQGYLDTNVQEDEEYQNKFIAACGISGTGVNKEFLDRYFEIMEAHKKRENRFDYGLAVRAVYGARPKKKLSSAQFTHIAKMANVINPENPTYDNAMADLFEFDKPVQTKLESRERLNIYLEFLNYINDTYQEMIDEKTIRQVLMVFQIKLKDYENSPSISSLKKVDFLASAAAKLKSAGTLV
jgi:hypothetical protein